MRLFRVTLFATLACLSVTANAQIDTDDAIIQKKIREIALVAGTPALQMAYWNGTTTNLYAYGKKEAGKPGLIDNETIFQAASLSKVVASYVFLILIDKGIIEFDKPLSTYYTYERLSEDKNKDLITARHVLTHTSGLVNWEANAGSEAWKKAKMWTKFTPGEKFMYSGEGMYYLQLVAEHVTKKSLNELAEQYIYKPFGMTHSSFVWNEAFAKNISLAHRDIKTSFGYIHKFKDGNAAFTLYTTASDYMKFILNSVVEGKGLSAQMHKNFLNANRSMIAKDDRSGGYNKKNICLGIMQQVNEEGVYYYHTGSNGGFRCIFTIHPKNKIAFAAFTNSNDGAAARKSLLRYVFGKDQTYWITM